MVIRQLPIWATTIIFWTSYAQMMTSVQAASTMDRSIGNFQIVLAGSLTVFSVQKLMLLNKAVNLDCTYVTLFLNEDSFFSACSATIQASQNCRKWQLGLY